MAVPANGLPPVLATGMQVCVVPPALRGPRWHKVKDVESADTGQLILLSDCESTNAAHELVGKYLLAQADSIAFDEEYEELDELVGLEVVDERLGLLGTVSEILTGSVQDILVVSSEHGEVMIPMVDELIWYADNEQSLESSIPVGLAPWDGSEAGALQSGEAQEGDD